MHQHFPINFHNSSTKPLFLRRLYPFETRCVARGPPQQPWTPPESVPWPMSLALSQRCGCRGVVPYVQLVHACNLPSTLRQTPWIEVVRGLLLSPPSPHP